MKELNRRKFLLFSASISLVTLTGCDKIVKYIKSKNLESKIRAILEKGDKLTVNWDCGGDQAIVSSFINQKEIDYQSELSSELDLYIINFLLLPSVGEFSMKGDGKIILENGNVFLICESIMLGYEDYNQNGESEGWIDINEREEEYSGKRKLFK